MKKHSFSSLLILLIFIMSIVFSGFTIHAQENIETMPEFKQESISISEYEVLKKLNEEYTEAKKNNKLNQNELFSEKSQEELYEIENFKNIYIEKIYKLKEWTLEDLRKVGYTDTQIKAIKEFDGSEEMLIQASTQVHVDIGFRNLVRSNSRTTVDLIAAFNCYGVISSNWFQDIFTVVFNTPFSIVSRDSTLRYYRWQTGESVYTNPTVLNNGLYGAEIKFYKYNQSSGGPYYIHSGSIVLGLSSNSYVADLQALASYGYTTFGNPTATIGWPPAISFGSGTKQVGQGYTYE